MLLKFGKVCWTTNPICCFANLSNFTSVNSWKISVFERCFPSPWISKLSCRPLAVKCHLFDLPHTYFRCNGVQECPNGSDEKGCPGKGGLHSPSIYRSKRLFFAAVGFLLVAIVGVLFLRFQSQGSKRRKEAVPTISSQISQMDSTMEAELSDDPPPPYPCNTPVDLQPHRTEISNEGNGSVSVEENVFDVKEKSPPPPYSDVLAGVYIQIFPGICDGNDNR